MIHPQTSESRASGENETIPVSDEQENGKLDFIFTAEIKNQVSIS